MLHTILLLVHVICAALIIGLVLIQRGKGADAGAGFGSGASGTVFGARGAGTALSRATAILAAVFMITSLSLAYTGTRYVAAPATILDKLASQQQEATPATAPAPAGVLPPPAPAAAPAAPAPPAAPAK